MSTVENFVGALAAGLLLGLETSNTKGIFFTRTRELFFNVGHVQPKNPVLKFPRL